jgi:hypothetical protein
MSGLATESNYPSDFDFFLKYEKTLFVGVKFRACPLRRQKHSQMVEFQVNCTSFKDKHFYILRPLLKQFKDFPENIVAP